MSQTVLLGDIATLHDKKRIPLNSRERAERKGSIPYYGATGVMDYVDKPLFDGEYVLIGEDGENLRSKKSDLAFKVSGKFWVNNHAHILQGIEPWVNDYIVNVFRMIDTSPYVTGAAQPKLNQKSLMRIPIYWPGKEEAKRIAKFFSNIDEKIELNRRMNETLEQIGQALFKEYFIDNPEAVSWKTVPISNKYSILLGGTPSRKMSEYWANGTIGWINSGKVNEFRITQPSELITEKALNKSAAKLLPKGSTVVAITGATLGQVSRVERSFAANQSVVGIVQEHDQFYNEFIYFWIKLNIDKLIGHQTGGAQQHINKGNIEDFPIIIPPDKLLKEFKTEITPLMELIGNNCLEAESLANLRDILLPRLISGKIKL